MASSDEINRTSSGKAETNNAWSKDSRRTAWSEESAGRGASGSGCGPHFEVHSARKETAAPNRNIMTLSPSAHFAGVSPSSPVPSDKSATLYRAALPSSGSAKKISSSPLHPSRGAGATRSAPSSPPPQPPPLSRWLQTRGKNLLRSADFVFPEEADDGFDAPLTEAWRQSAREGAAHGLFADVDDCPGHKVRWVSRQKPFFFVKSAEALGAMAMQSQSPRIALKKVVGIWSEPGTIEFFCYETNRPFSYYTLAHLFQAFDCRLNTGVDGQDPFAPSVLTQVVTAGRAPPGHTPRRAPRRHKWVNVDPGRSPAKQVELREDNGGVRCFRREDNEGIVLGVSPCGRFVLLRLRLEHAWLQNMNPRQDFSRQCNPIATMFGRVASAASRNPDHATAYPTVYLMWDLCDGGQGGRVILLPNLEYPDVFDRDEGFHLKIPTTRPSGRESTATSEISTAPSTSSGVQEGGHFVEVEDPEAPSYVEVVDFRTWLKKKWVRRERHSHTSSGSRCWLYVLANLLLPTRSLGRRLGAQEKEAHMRALFHQGKEEAEMVDRTRFQHGDVHKKHKSLFDSTISNWDRLLGGTRGADLLGDEETSEDEGCRSCFGGGTTRRAEVDQLKGRGNAISMAFLQRTDVGKDWSPLVHGWARSGGNELWYN